MEEPLDASDYSPAVGGVLTKPNLDVATQFRYLPQLDGVRAIAVLAVLAEHAQLSFAVGGGVGVDLFFVLSGYLITTLLLQEFAATGTISLRSFYGRRIRRLLPALVAVAAFSFIAFSIVRPFETNATILGIVTSLLYISCWFRAFGISELGWFGHTWSLSVEEHFYFFWPPLLLWICRRGIGNLRRWVLGLFALAVVYRVVTAATGASGARLKNSPDLRADQLLAGCALAVLLLGMRSYRAERWDKWWTMLVALSIADLARMVVFPFAFGLAWFRNASADVVAVEAAVIIGYLVVRNRSLLTRTLSHPSLVWLGRRSYAVYLWHLPLFGLLGFKGQPTPYRVGGRFAAVVLTFVAAWASFKWVESPLYKRRVEGATPGEKGAPRPEEDLAVRGGHPLRPAAADQDATKVSEP